MTGPGIAPAPAGTLRHARRGYHHGRLREALIEASKALLAEKGPQGFTLADAARLAGVSPAAPYRHFADREALLGAVASEGFRAFAGRLEAAGREGVDARDGFRRMGRAYLAFARGEPGFYVAMFSSRLPEGAAPLADSEAAFQVLTHGIARLVAAHGAEVADLQALAVQIWSLAHGVATLDGGGRLSRCRIDVEATLGSGVDALLAAALRQASPKNPSAAL